MRCEKVVVLRHTLRQIKRSDLAKVIYLNSIKLRPYQIGVIDAIENKGIRRAILVWP